MIERYVNGSFVPCANLGEVRRGDYFRFVVDRTPGVIMVAHEDASQRPSRNDPSRLVWAVDASSAVGVDTVVPGRLH